MFSRFINLNPFKKAGGGSYGTKEEAEKHGAERGRDKIILPFGSDITRD
jgi:hypothetical protein